MTRRRQPRPRVTAPRTRRSAAAPAPRVRRATARGLFDPREITRVVALMEESGLVELEIESGSEKVRLVRADHRGSSPPPAPRVSGTEGKDGAGPAPRSSACGITSPMVGTFHRAPAPGARAFVEVGDVVERGQVLCVIEAMKMMNEIEAEYRGRVTRILLENGAPVEFGETLFLIEPQ